MGKSKNDARVGEEELREGELWGYTFEDDHKFRVPKLGGPMEMNPLQWSRCEWVSKLSTLNLLLPVFGVPLWITVTWFFFWRAMYDLGLGLLLHWQSTSQGMTRLAGQILARPRESLLRRFFVGVCRDGHPDYDVEKEPLCLTAWVAYRHYADTVLAWDLMSYFGAILSCVKAPEGGFTGIVICEYVIGAVLCAFALWAKMDSYRVVKDYAWYWGDFFFRVKGDLSFDRVFNIAPHPMYSIGYAFFYGSAIIARSPVAFYVSVIAHLCQFAFLFLAETPHMRKIYPELVDSDPSSPQAVKDRLLHDKNTGYFAEDELVGLRHFNPLRSADRVFVIFSLITAAVYAYLIICHPLHSSAEGSTGFGICAIAAAAIALFWRVTLSGGLGVILYLQSTQNWWVKRFAEKGADERKAFSHWKTLYNIVHGMTCLSFFLTAAYFRGQHFLSPGLFFVPQTVGALLCLLSYTTIVSVFHDIGEYGWFYGDFFIPRKKVPTQLVYTGVFRFLDNPDCIVGFAAFYGIAIFFESPVAFVIAVLSQLTNYLFVIMVERPHMKRFYGKQVRTASGVESALDEIISDAINKVENLKMD